MVDQNWDTVRIVQRRHDHVQWMHDYWADRVISGEQILTEIGADDQLTETGAKVPAALDPAPEPPLDTHAGRHG